MIGDKTTDKSIKSQFSIVVRYLKGDSLTERCIGMINQSNLKGNALANTILSHLNSKLALRKNDWSRLWMERERVLCLEKKKAFKRL